MNINTLKPFWDVETGQEYSMMTSEEIARRKANSYFVKKRRQQQQRSNENNESSSIDSDVKNANEIDRRIDEVLMELINCRATPEKLANLYETKFRWQMRLSFTWMSDNEANQKILDQAYLKFPDNLNSNTCSMLQINVGPRNKADIGTSHWIDFVYIARKEQSNGNAGIGLFAARRIKQGWLIGAIIGKEIWVAPVVGSCDVSVDKTENPSYIFNIWSEDYRKRLIQCSERPHEWCTTLGTHFIKNPFMKVRHYDLDEFLSLYQTKEGKTALDTYVKERAACEKECNAIMIDDGVVIAKKHIGIDVEIKMNFKKCTDYITAKENMARKRPKLDDTTQGN